MTKHITLLYDHYASWEKDFICHELMPSGTSVHPLNPQSVAAQRNNRSSALAIAVSSNHITFREIANWCKILKPNVIFHLSDESAPGRRNSYNKLARNCSLYLRQYNHSSYNYHPNTRFMALGFGSGLLAPGERSWDLEIVPSAQRALPWAFVGALKQDRPEMIAAFQAISGGHIETDGVSIQAMRSIYEQAVFAPCGRGNSVLDCFRIYEAIILGAIPVVVGSPSEVITNLLHISPTVPFLRFDNWSQASSTCSNLISEREELQSLQDQCLLSWREHLRTLQSLVSLALASIQT
jgi:hypothetical protein